ncbi:MAG: 16S rRNA processing protein RimM [Candidatus Marinimicrobia bacterium]|jgi:16S rRNA processing protein RimM|nr:16S rRNA processing protein RimM [Candidatus Neomarinimicrobiota bacterium]MBT3618385.1 16S rRNA processing protein RimM [Candidatus Neomarinimicrobiota bacterium]MBT3829180.1 16S rRNA processing protein RimM [Candidatus Neomarinimicrobiota bacterium]MBT3998148.1 16S rRNA processing protein RimM [Candidatus Neomarinimicrobiota bacterium]MBT4281489.1 16S rRNA processing protein RimM [Candidatus Neomarinimicrobiota bacterium]
MNKLFPIGKVTKVSGLKGEVHVIPLCRYFEDYAENPTLFLGYSNDSALEMKLKKSARIGKKTRILFEGVQNRLEAEALVGQKVFTHASESDPISFVSQDLIGYEVFTDSGKFVGNLKDILWLPANDVYTIEKDEKEFLIPVISEIVNSIDHNNEEIVIRPIDGLMDH